MHPRALTLVSALLALACAPSPSPDVACGDCSFTQPAWHIFSPAPFDQFALPIAVDDEGVVTLADVSRDAMVLRQLDPSGALRWERTWPGDVASVLLSSAPGGHVHLAAVIGESIELHTGETRTASEHFVLLARLDERGELAWVRTTVGGHAHVDATTTLGDTLVVSGRMGGSVFLGGATHEVSDQAAFVARYDGSGVQLAEIVLDGAERGAAVLSALAVGAGADVYATGMLIGELDLGGGLRAGEAASPRWLVLALDHGLNHRWDALVEADTLGGGLAIDADGSGVVSAGSSARHGMRGTVVVRYDADGTEGVRHDLPEHRVTAVHLEDTGGTLVLAGDVRPSGERPGSLFLTSLASSGEPLWQRSWDDADANLRSLHRVRDGFVLSADFSGALELGDGTRLASDRRDALMLAAYCACAVGS